MSGGTLGSKEANENGKRKLETENNQNNIRIKSESGD